MSLATFHDLVRTLLNRGNKYDALIVAGARLAARFLEENWTLPYMRGNGYIALSTETYDFSTAVFPSQEVKAIEWLRIATFGSDFSVSYDYLERMDPRDWSELQRDVWPQAYASFRDRTSRNLVRFNAVPSTQNPALIEYQASFYTAWPTDTSQSPAILAFAEGAMLYETARQVLLMARDPETAATYESLVQTRMTTLVNAEAERENAGRSEIMAFS